MSSKNGLGRGLSALLGDEATEQGDNTQTLERAGTSTQASIAGAGAPSSQVTSLAITALVPGKFQPRRYFNDVFLAELTESIKENGIIQPIVVRELDTDGNYQIIAGERRWRASKRAGLTEVPVIIQTLTDKQALEFALVENIQRQNLTPVEEAEGYQRLIDEFAYTQVQLAEQVGKSRSHITNMLRILQLPNEVLEHIHKEDISMGHARVLAGVENPTQLAETIIKKKLSVRETEKFASGHGTTKRTPKASEAQQPPQETIITTQSTVTKPATQGTVKNEDIIMLEQSIMDHLGLNISIDEINETGQVTIEFTNLADLDKIIQKLSS